jgi:hypothetical protein
MGNNASVLDVGGTRVIAHDAADRSGTVELTAGTHTVRVLYFDTTDPAAELTVDYVGPGFTREAIPAEAFPRLTAIPLDPLAGASDPDAGDVLTISHIDGQPIALNTPVQLATGAAVQLNGDGTITYLPAPGRTVFHAATDDDSFTYTVTDTGGLSTTATAQLELARQNTAPVSRGPLALNVNQVEIAQILAADAADDADGDELRITHVNGQPLPGGLVRSLPSSARVSLTTDPPIFNPELSPNLPRAPFGLRYDALSSFLFTLDQTTGSDAFTLTVADAAGATVDVDFAGTWPLYGEFRLGYNDSRFDGGLGAQTARIFSRYRFNIDALVAITDRQTGLRYGQRSQQFNGGQDTFLTFDLPAGIDLEGAHFFDRFDLEIDTPQGVPIFYGFSSGNVQLEALHSTAEKSFFRLTGAISPHWPFMVTTTAGTAPYKSGIRLIEAPYGSGVDVTRLGILVRSVLPNKNVLEPSFAANILVTGICRTRDISRFTVANNTSETVPLTVGAGQAVFTFAPGETRTIEVPYAPKVPFLVHSAELGLFDSNEVTCPLGLSFTATPLCSDSFFAFVSVRNNNLTESFTVRVESVDIQSIRSDPQVIGSQAEEFIQLNTQGVNLGGTEGRIRVILPDSEEIVETFIFSSASCS